MPNLKLSDWAHISEIGAAIVVVLSLIYVGFEINQNTVALQQASYQSVQETMQNTELALATNSELLEIVMEVETSPSEASLLEWRMFTHIVFTRMGTWEYLYLARQDDALSETQWEAFDPFFVTLICRPGYKLFWEKNHRAFSSSFGSHIDSTMATECIAD